MKHWYRQKLIKQAFIASDLPDEDELDLDEIDDMIAHGGDISHYYSNVSEITRKASSAVRGRTSRKPSSPEMVKLCNHLRFETEVK